MNCTRQNLHSMSELCLKAWENGNSDYDKECFPHSTMGTLFGTLSIVSSAIGFIGNFLTVH